jgi:hypothetical protein
MEMLNTMQEKADANRKADQEKADANRTKGRELMLAKIRADRTKDREQMLTMRQEMNANTKAMQELQDLKSGQAKMIPGSGQVGFVVDKVAPGQVFSEYFGFPCHSFHRILHPHNHPGQVQ